MYWGVLCGLKRSNLELVKISTECFAISDNPPKGKLQFSQSMFFPSTWGEITIRYCFRTVSKSAEQISASARVIEWLDLSIDDGLFFGKFCILRLGFSLTSLRIPLRKAPPSGSRNPAAQVRSFPPLPTTATAVKSHHYSLWFPFRRTMFLFLGKCRGLVLECLSVYLSSD